MRKCFPKKDERGQADNDFSVTRFTSGVSLFTVSYEYDPFGRRLWKEVDGIKQYFIYCDEGLAGELDQNGSLTKTYGWKPNSTWTTDPVFMREGESYYYYHNDHLGTPQKLTAQNGQVVWSAKYTAFGEAVIDPASLVTNNLRFPGQYADDETQLHYNYHRYYDPRSGRYLTPDPIEIQQGKNHLYAYVKNNPINSYDPNGLAEVVIRRFAWGPLGYLFPPRHCYIKWSDGSTSTYDGRGVHPDEVPNTWFKISLPIKDKNYQCPCNEDCLKNYMDSQDREDEPNHGFRGLKHNCCDAVRNAIKNCGCDVPFRLKILNEGDL